MDDIEKRMIELEHRMERLEEQSEHRDSLYESEQRVSVGQGKRIDSNELKIEWHQKAIERFEITLFNTGKGLTYQVDRLIQRVENNKASLALWISVVSVIGSILAIIFK
jgi:hypothetical protein